MQAVTDGLVPLDWVILGVLLVSILIGLWRGFIYELLALANWAQAALLGSWLGGAVSEWLGLGSWTPQARQILGFVLVFVIVLLVGGWLASWIKGWVARSGLRAADRALGGLFGVLRGALVLILAAMVVHGMALQTSSWWLEARSARWLDGGVVMVRSLWAAPPPVTKD